MRSLLFLPEAKRRSKKLVAPMQGQPEKTKASESDWMQSTAEVLLPERRRRKKLVTQCILIL